MIDDTQRLWVPTWVPQQCGPSATLLSLSISVNKQFENEWLRVSSFASSFVTVENKHSQTWTKIPAWKKLNFYTFTGNLRMDGYVCIGTKNCQSVLSWKKTCQSLDLLTVIYIVHKQPIIGRMKWRSMF